GDDVPPPAEAAPAPEPVAPVPAPTLQDVQALTHESDFSAFVARGVAPEVRNAAMKKLFGDPRFNVMDGLDVYVEDYTRPDPISETTCRPLPRPRQHPNPSHRFQRPRCRTCRRSPTSPTSRPSWRAAWRPRCATRP